MPKLLLLARNGNRLPVSLTAGQTLASALKQHHALLFATRNGVERQEGMKWEEVSTSYVIKPGDVLRVRNPFQASSGKSMGDLLLRILRSVRPRRRREASRTRK